MFMTQEIEGRTVKISTRIRPAVNEYTVYDNKIWRVTGSEGAGKRYKCKLEREEHKEVIWVSERLPLIVRPTGNIPV